MRKAIKALPFKLKMKAVWMFWLNYSVNDNNNNNNKEMNFIKQVKQSPYYDKIPKALKETKSKLSSELLELGKIEGLVKDVDNAILESVIGATLFEIVNLVVNSVWSETQHY